MSQQVIEGWYTKLTASQGVGTFYSAVGGRLYDTQAPQPVPAFPYMVSTVVDDPVGRYFNAKEKQDITMQCDLYGSKSPGFESLGDIEVLLFDLMDRATLTVSGHDRGIIRCIRRGIRVVEEDALRIIDEFRVEATSTS